MFMYDIIVSSTKYA